MQHAGRISSVVHKTKSAIDDAEESLSSIKSSLDALVGDDESPTPKIITRFTGSIQDEELTEAIEDAYNKHGYALVGYIRQIADLQKPVIS